MVRPPHSSRLPVELFARQCAINTKRRPRTFGGGYDSQLHVLDDVSRYENTGNVRGFVLATTNATLMREMTTERFR